MMIDYEKILREANNEEIEKAVSSQFSKSIKKNRFNYIKTYKKEIGLLNKVLSLYFYLSQVITPSEQTDKFYRRYLLGEGYIVTIANNFFVIKELFLDGLHIQLQIMLRTQIEMINNLIAFIGDDDYYLRYGTDSHETPDGYIAPKMEQTKKAIKKVIKDSYVERSNEYIKIYIDLLDTLYKELSEATHGKFVNIKLQAMGVNDDDELLDNGMFGVDKPIGATKNLLSHSYLLFQLSFLLIRIQLNKKGLLNRDNVFYDILNSFDKIDLLNYEGLYER